MVLNIAPLSNLNDRCAEHNLRKQIEGLMYELP